MDPLVPHNRWLGKKMEVMEASLNKIETGELQARFHLAGAARTDFAFYSLPPSPFEFSWTPCVVPCRSLLVNSLLQSQNQGCRDASEHVERSSEPRLCSERTRLTSCIEFVCNPSTLGRPVARSRSRLVPSLPRREM